MLICVIDVRMRGPGICQRSTASAKLEIFRAADALNRREAGHERGVQISGARERRLRGRVAVAVGVQRSCAVDVPAWMDMRVDQTGQECGVAELVRGAARERAGVGRHLLDASRADCDERIADLVAASVDRGRGVQRDRRTVGSVNGRVLRRHRARGERERDAAQGFSYGRDLGRAVPARVFDPGTDSAPAHAMYAPSTPGREYR